MITLIWGLPRAGKTALMTSIAVSHMRGVQAYKDLRVGMPLLKKLNAGGYGYSLPYKHLVFSDYAISLPGGKIQSHETDGWRVGLPDPNFRTDFLPPGAFIFLDEAQKYYNSRNGQKMSDRVSRFYELHGHFQYTVYLASQRPKLIDLNIRELANEVIEVVTLKHKYDYGRIVRSEWTCNRYDNAARAISYIEGGKVGQYGERVKFVYEGNIFRRYDSRGQYPAFLDGRSEHSFDVRDFMTPGYSPPEIKAYNYKHSYKTPPGFLDKRS